MIFSIAAAFLVIANRMYNIANIIKTSYNKNDDRLTVHYEGGGKEYIQGDEVAAFQKAVAPFVLNPPEPEPEVHVETSGCEAITPDVTVTTGDQGEVNTGETDNESEIETSDGEPSELEAAGIPSDLAALLHAGGVNTVDEVLTHPDLQKVEGIGKGRKENILAILKPAETT